MDEAEGLLCGYQITSDGRARPLSLEGDTASAPADGWSWIHLDVNGSRTEEWLLEQSGLDQHTVTGLLATETRPRATVSPTGTLIILRGVNLHPDSDPTDMISVRLWVEPQRIISTRVRRLLSIQALRQRCEDNVAPGDVGQFIVDLNVGLIERMSGVVTNLDEEIDDLDQADATQTATTTRRKLASARQKIIPLRRFLSPQRDAISQLITARVDWLGEWQRGQLRECADRLTRYVEELDAMREKAAVIQDNISAVLSEQMNRHMLLLSIVAAIFLPLGLLTGLLGINVGGIPGAETPLAFWIVVFTLIAIAGLEIWLFMRLGLIDDSWLRGRSGD